MNKLKITVAFLVLTIVFGLSFNLAFAGGLIEFKKAYVINSPDVCGDKMCDEEEQTSYGIQKNKHTPIGQFNLGIPIDKIVCRDGLEFVLKLSNWHPACVKPENVLRLIEIGWAASPQEKDQIFLAAEKKEPPQYDPLVEYRKVFPLRQGVGLTITPDEIQGNSYLLFEGYGWHRLHNVEITISNEHGKVEFLMSQTDVRGDLYMPWQIPLTIEPGWYHIFAKDGIHEYEIDIPITPPQK